LKKLFTITLFLIFISGYSQNTDIDLLRKINVNRNKSLDGSFQFISNTTGLVSFGIPVAVLGTGIILGDSSLKQKGILLGSSLILTSGITYIMKNSIKRSRPYKTYPDIDKLSSGGSYSFPSGHTSEAFSTATSVSLAFPKWYVIVPSFSWATAVGYSRMHLGVHYPSDVLAGALIGAGSSYLCFKAQKWLNKKRMNK
jgi:membrane-associated phospholipid phosphatase